jgi:glycosyltransferase involved in cell wall biosynthesis
MLDIPQEARVLLFVADSVANRRKGMSLLVETLEDLQHREKLFLLSVGGSAASIDTAFSYLHLGKLSNDRLLAMAYSAADIFVIPSLQDNLPNTVLEAMACGVPVVGFATGGIPDMVRPGITGLLVPTGNVALLRSAIEQLLDDPETRAAMGRNARRIAVAEYALEVQARRYVSLYHQIISS